MSFQAQFSGYCLRCRGPIEVGEEIETLGSGRYETYGHVSCPVSAELAEKVFEATGWRPGSCSICGSDSWADCACP